MIVRIDLDPKLVWKLTEHAERAGVKLPEYLAGMIALKSPTSLVKRGSRQEQIIKLHGEGFTDHEIAERLECVRAYVTQIRGRHGLKPNRRRA
ncbi:MAG: hypothetical protein D3X82_13950 [Candidatus Leucobacter sulfamidivorax]|nr:hypothetical protein [Candidatus Leucobacter sulfamidivorax]